MSKNTRIRILLTACAALLLVVVSVAGTMAWLQDDTDEIINTFDPTKVDIDLTETEDGEDKHFDLLPGKEHAKNPTVIVNADSENCWVFVEITGANDPETYLNAEIASGWTKIGTETGLLGVYWREVASSTSDQTFDVLKNNKVTVKNTVGDTVLMPAAGAEPTLSFQAYAIQKDSLTDGTTAITDAATAWNTFFAAP